MKLENKVAIVTGGAMGNGLGIVKVFLKEGAKVAILDYDEKTNLAKLEQRNYFKKGDKVEIFGPDKDFNFKIEEIYDEDKKPIEIVRHPKQIVYLKMPKEVSVNDMMKIC